MNIQVQTLFFAALSDMLGVQSLEFELTEPISAEDLFMKAALQRKVTEPPSYPIRYAINEEFASGNTLLKDGDIVAYLPPMSGG